MKKTFEDYFGLKEIFCPHAYHYYIEILGYSNTRMYAMIDPRVKANWLWLRESLGKEITINNWAIGGPYDERGMRCALCDLVKDKTEEEIPYLTPHVMGQGFDGTVKGLMARVVRQYILDHSEEVPFPGRIEMKKSWLHWDCIDMGVKIYKLYV